MSYEMPSPYHTLVTAVEQDRGKCDAHKIASLHNEEVKVSLSKMCRKIYIKKSEAYTHNLKII